MQINHFGLWQKFPNRRFFSNEKQACYSQYILLIFLSNKFEILKEIRVGQFRKC